MYRLVKSLAVAFFACLSLGAVSAAEAEVVIGDNVRIYGHKIAPSRWRSVHAETIHHRPPYHGCRDFPAGAVVDGRLLTAPARICFWRPIAH
jgi:hypothetical protein